jgi:hypothetical protein
MSSAFASPTTDQTLSPGINSNQVPRLCADFDERGKPMIVDQLESDMKGL